MGRRAILHKALRIGCRTKEGVMAALSKEIAAYDRMRSYLEMDYFGKWIVMHDEELIGSYESFEAAADQAVRRFGRGPYLIRQVGEGPITLPASALYNPVNANY